MENKGFMITQKEKELIQDKLTSISDFQRLSSLLVWIGIAMVILHIAVDIFFHVTS